MKERRWGGRVGWNVAWLAIVGVLHACAGGGGGGGGGAPKPTCKPPAGGATISFGSTIQPIFNQSCALAGCHVGPVPTENLDLTAGVSHNQLVGVASLEMPKLKRVKPGDPDASYMIQKIEAQPNLTPMPL